MLLIFCLNLSKDQLQRKPGEYFLARGPVRLRGAQGPNAGKDGIALVYCNPLTPLLRFVLFLSYKLFLL